MHALGANQRQRRSRADVQLELDLWIQVPMDLRRKSNPCAI